MRRGTNRGRAGGTAYPHRVPLRLSPAQHATLTRIAEEAECSLAEAGRELLDAVGEGRTVVLSPRARAGLESVRDGEEPIDVTLERVVDVGVAGLRMAARRAG